MKIDVKLYIKFIFLLFFIALPVSSYASYEVNTKAKSMYLYDMQSSTVIYNKAGFEKIKPGAMTKLMTAYVAFEKIKEKKIFLDDVFNVSRNVSRLTGQKNLLKFNDNVTLELLLNLMITQSSNAASVMIAEIISENENNFVINMNTKVNELGMTKTNFINVTGVDADDQYTTAHDMVVLSKAIINQHSEYMHFFSKLNFKYKNNNIVNRNPVLYGFDGGDGLKTSFIPEDGYGLVATAIRNGRRLILVQTGFTDRVTRHVQARKIMNEGFSNFVNKKIFNKGQKITKVNVFQGQNEEIDVVTIKDLYILKKKNRELTYKINIEYSSPLLAPVLKYQEIGYISINCDNKMYYMPLTVNKSSKIKGFFGRIISSFNYLVFGIV